MSVANNRIEWIDAIRGVAIILVVYSHIMFFWIEDTQEVVNSYLIRFRMPLFFFISGFFLWSPEYTFAKLLQRTKNRLFRQLYPTVIITGIFFLTLYTNYFSWLIFTPGKGGYWFTFVMVEMFLIIAPLLFLMDSFKLSKAWQTAVLLFVMLLSIIIKPFINRMTGYDFFSSRVSGFFSLMYINLYLRYLIFGMALRINEGRLMKVVAGVPVFIGSVVIFFCARYIISNDIIYSILEGLSGICIVFFLFKKLTEYKRFAHSKIISELKNLGKHTIEIYLLHYFVIYGVKKLPVTEVFGHLHSTPFAFFVAMIMAVLITYLVVFFAAFLRRVKLYNILFGKF